MRKVFLILLFTSFLLPVGVGARAIQPTIYPDLFIQIKPTKPQPTIKPLSIEQSDIEAYYNNGVLTLVFNRDLGDADIVVTNLTTDEIWSDNVSGVGSTIIFLSGVEEQISKSVNSEHIDHYIH